MLNLIWLVFGGFVLAAKWFVAGVLCVMLVVTIPWARACFTMASHTALPFGRQVIRRELLTGEQDLGTGPLGDLGNASAEGTSGNPQGGGGGEIDTDQAAALADVIERHRRAVELVEIEERLARLERQTQRKS